jgi:PLP dependent protein
VIASIEANLTTVRETIERSAARSGRPVDAITLVAVTKTLPVPRIREAIALGLRTLGENRVQEALPKIAEIGSAAGWHLIGHLQSNKVRFIEGNFQMVQSVDSISLVDALGRRLRERLDILIEVNVAAEPQKTGATPADVGEIASAVQRHSLLRLQGLMTIAPLVADAEEVRPVFRRLRTFRDELSQRIGRPLPILSMGMTDDYPVAIEEGATMLRLGRALFGAR